MRNAGLDEAQPGIKIARTNINKPQICRWHHPYGRKRRTKVPLDESERESEKLGLKLKIQKTKIMASGPITSWQIGKQWKQWETLFWGAPKSLQMVTAAMKFKRCFLLGRKAMTNLGSILKSRDITLPTKVLLVNGFSSGHVWMWELDYE